MELKTTTAAAAQSAPISSGRSVPRESPAAAASSPEPGGKRSRKLLAAPLQRLFQAPAVISILVHLVLLTFLAVQHFSLKEPRQAMRATVIADTVVDMRKDIFESLAWEVEDAPTLRDPGGGLKSLAELEQEASIDDAQQAVAGLSAIASGRNRLGLSDGQAAGANSLAEGLGDGGGSGAGSADFFGASAKGKSVLYVIDRSFSMNSNRAMRLAITELIRSLKSLGPFMEFQVVFYNTKVDLLQLPGRGMVRASPGNLERARQQIEAVSPEGGTDHVNALKRALDFHPDIIMFLTDAEDITPEQIEIVTRQNQRRRRGQSPASINVIQFHHEVGRAPVTTSEKLAKLNNGTYRLIETTRTP